MSRYKGRSDTKLVERDFPHIVEMAVVVCIRETQRTLATLLNVSFCG